MKAVPENVRTHSKLWATGLYVNGPTGRLATYYQNSTSQLYFYLNDHLGNARVLVNTTGQTQYYAYYPFGEIIEAAGNHGTEFQFTGKERDAHGRFGFDYFGARYYDSRIGSFTTVDKAGQFASGYVYGANNPLIGVDADGNFFFAFLAPALWGALYSVGPAAVMTVASGGSWKDFGNAVLSGAITGGIGGGLSAVAGKAANGAAFGLLSHAGASVGTSAIMGQDISLKGMAASTIGGLAGDKLVGSYNTKFANGFANMLDESAQMATAGLVSGAVTQMTSNVLNGRPMWENTGNMALLGAASGATAGVWKSALIGAPRLGPSSEKTAKRLEAGKWVTGVKSNPVYRSGGAWGFLSSIGVLEKGYAGFGRDVLINESNDPNFDNDYLWLHETTHFWQYKTDGYGRVINRLGAEQLSRLANLIPGVHVNPYERIGAAEWHADYITERLQTLY